MGGVGSVLSRIASKAIPRLAEGESNEFGRVANDVFGAKDAYFRIGGKAGEAVAALHGDYQIYRAQAEKSLDKPLVVLTEAINSQELRSRGITAQSKLGDIYAHAKAINHPIAQAQGALDQLVANGAAMTDVPDRLRYNHIAKARVIASSQAFGPNYENLIPHIMEAYDSGDPNRIIWAQGVMNLVSNETHDTKMLFNPLTGGMQEGSATKAAIAKAFSRENKVRELLERPQLPTIKTNPTYHSPNDLERRITNIQRAVQLPFVALKHISQYGNLSSIPAPLLVKGLLSMGDQEFKNFLDASAILAYNEHDIMSRALEGGSGVVAKWTGSPTVGSLFFRAYHMPFFDYLRVRQLSTAASVGYQSAQHWAMAAMEGNKRAIAELKEMHIDPAEVIRQNGKLTEEQLQKGIFHFVNNRFFMDKSIEQSQYANMNLWTRSATRYHTFVNAQQRFMRRELGKMWKAGDALGIAQFVGTIGVLYPSIAPMLKGLELAFRTGNPTMALEQTKEDYANLRGKRGTGMAVNTYLDMLAHYASFGVYTSYVQAAHGNRFAYQVLGPSIGVPARVLEDTLNMVTRANKAGKHNAAPVIRDILEDTLPIAGNILAHKIAPTTKEAPKGRIHRPARVRSRPKPWEF